MCPECNTPGGGGGGQGGRLVRETQVSVPSDEHGSVTFTGRGRVCTQTARVGDQTFVVGLDTMASLCLAIPEVVEAVGRSDELARAPARVLTIGGVHGPEELKVRELKQVPIYLGHAELKQDLFINLSE